MFETDKYDRTLHLERPASPRVAYEPVDNIRGMSFLFWAEHCVECAAPSCYSSCDLYQPRSDWRCRRFAFGAYKNPAFRSLRGYGVEVRFKKWAKLETFANTAIYPVSKILRIERSLERVARVGNLIGNVSHYLSPGSNLEQLTYIGLGKISRRLHQRHRFKPRPEAFLLEVYNPAEHETRLQVIFSPIADSRQNGHDNLAAVAPKITTLVLKPGYSRHTFQAAVFEPFVERELPFLITLLPEAESHAHLVFLTADFVTFRPMPGAEQSADAQSPIKCIVWDLDNTVWSGTLVEGDELTLRPGIIEILRYLDERGILMSIASKNDAQLALAKLKEFRIEEYFLYPQIDWSPKSSKIKRIAQQLNIGLDALAFIDDNPFELAEVSAALPQLTCISADELDSLTTNPRLQGNVTDESRQRRRYYQQQIARELEQASFAGDYPAFLKSCKIVLDISPYRPSDEERVAELVQRTNQLNFSGRKYSRAQLQQIIDDSRLEKYVLRCADRYGNYGAVGFCIVQQMEQQLRINDLMLSCRVQGKFIEQALFSHLFRFHNRYAARTLWVNFRSTDRNTPARLVLESLGFQPCRSEGGGLELQQCDNLNCDLISVICASETVEAQVSELA
jgi:FkbH-like protein